MRPIPKNAIRGAMITTILFLEAKRKVLSIIKTQICALNGVRKRTSRLVLLIHLGFSAPKTNNCPIRKPAYSTDLVSSSNFTPEIPEERCVSNTCGTVFKWQCEYELPFCRYPTGVTQRFRRNYITACATIWRCRSLVVINFGDIDFVTFCSQTVEDINDQHLQRLGEWK